MKKILKYQCFDLAKALVVYYLVIILIIALAVVGLNVTGSTKRGGLGFSSEFFCFIVGLCMFREYFYLFMQNSVSRKKIFAGACMCLVVLSAVMSIMNVLALHVFEALPGSNITYMTLSSTLYYGYMTSAGPVLRLLIELVITFLLMYAFFVVGYLISICFYRSPKSGKIGIAVGLPLLVVGGIPVLMVAFPEVFARLMSLFLFCMGYSDTSSGNPFIGMVSLTVFSLVITGISYRAVKGAQI